MSNSEDSVIDVIYQMKEMLENQQQQIQMLQVSLNTIGAKVNKTLYPDFSAPKGEPSPPPVKDLSHLYQPGEATPEPTAEPEPPSVEKPPTETPAPVPKQRRNVRVFGHFDDEKGKPLSGVMVRIMDANNNVVKQTKSNRAGLWMSFLPPGTYVAEFAMAGMQPEARQFQLFEGQKEVEVN